MGRNHSHANHSTTTLLLGLTGFILTFIGTTSCNFLEIKDGAVDGVSFQGNAGLTKFQDGAGTCESYTSEEINSDIYFQIAFFSGWGSTIAAALGVWFSIIHTYCLPVMDICILLSYGFSIIFVWLTFFLKLSDICKDCSLGSGAYINLSAWLLLSFPYGSVICMFFCMWLPRPIPIWCKAGVRKAEDMALGGQQEGETKKEYQKRKNAQELEVGLNVALVALGPVSAPVAVGAKVVKTAVGSKVVRTAATKAVKTAAGRKTKKLPGTAVARKGKSKKLARRLEENLNSPNSSEESE
jgi:hypothetical protein